MFSVLYNFFGFKNSGLTLAIWALVGTGRSGVMIGLIWSLNSHTLPSCDQKTKYFNDKKSNDYFNVSVGLI